MLVIFCYALLLRSSHQSYQLISKCIIYKSNRRLKLQIKVSEGLGLPLCHL